MFKRLSISYKIALIAVIGFIGFAIYQGVNYQLSLEIRNRLGYLISEEFPVLRFSNYVQVNFSELDELYQAALAESDLDTLLEADQKADDIEAEFSQIESSYQINNTSFYELSALFNKYRQSISLHTRQVIERRLTYDEVIEGYSKIGLIRQQLLDSQNQFLESRYQSFASSLNSMEEDEEFIIEFGLGLGIILLGLLGLFSALIIHRITAAFQLGVDFAQTIAAGNLNATIHTSAQDETGQLIISLNAMRQVLKKQSRDNQVREHEQLFLSGMNDAMRGDPRLQDLADKVCSYVLENLPIIDSLGFYLRVDEDNLVILDAQSREKQPPVSLLYEHALKVNDERIAAALAAKDFLHFKGHILSTEQTALFTQKQLHDMSQRWIYFPIMLENEMKALIVMGCNTSLDNESKQLLSKANNGLAIAINSAQARKKVANMLEQTQLQAKELTKQQRELALINDQLEDKTLDLDKQKNNILEKNELLEASQELLLEKSTALEASGRYKSQFLSTMSHELRTPLNSILLLSESLLDNREKNLSEKQVRHADVIHNAGEELLNLINDILDLSKVEEGKMDVIIDAISPAVFLNKIKSQSEVLANNKKLSFDISCDEGLPEYFYSDEQRLYQILKNFVSNALKFTETGGITITVSMTNTSELPMSLIDNDQQSFICFQVVDSGVGIAPNKQQVIFEAFKQADGTTSRKFGGTGLGLTISRELAHLLDGEVTLSSQGIGHGASFMVYIPIGDIKNLSIADTVVDHSDIKPLISVDAALPLLQKFPLPRCLPVETLLFLITNKDWQDLLNQKSELSPIKFKWISELKELEKYLHFNLPRAVVIDSDSQLLVQFMAETDLQLPFFTIGDSIASRIDNEVEVLSWFDQHHLNHIVERVFLSADTSLARVLFVEDNPVFHEVIRAVFIKQGLCVDIVSDASAAIETLYHKTYELIVVDLNLPDFSGEQVMQIMRSIPAFSDKQVVLFTAEDLQADYKVKLLQYANEVVFKSPQAIHELALKAHTLVNKSKDSVYKVDFDHHNINGASVYQKGSLRGSRILLVDDDDRNLYSLGCALEAEGIIVYQAQSGVQALEILSSQQIIDLVLLDIMMPEMDGYQVVNHIRQNPHWKLLPVIALTAKAMVGDKQRCLDAGASDYLSKPVSMKDLLNKISSYIR